MTEICFFLVATLKIPVMNLTADQSPHVDDTVTFNGRLDPTNSTWMKVIGGLDELVPKMELSSGILSNITSLLDQNVIKVICLKIQSTLGYYAMCL